MKKTLQFSAIALCCAAIISIASCEKGPLIANFNFADMTASVQASPFNNYQVFTFPVNHADVVSTVSGAGVSDLTRVNSAKLKSINAAVTTSGGNLDQTDGVEVYLKFANTPNDSVQIAYGNTFPSGTAQAVLNIEGQDLKNLLSNDATIIVKILPKAAGIGATTVKFTGAVLEISIKK